MRIGVSVQAQKIDLMVRCSITSIAMGSILADCQAWTVCILIRIEEDIGTIVLVVTEP